MPWALTIRAADNRPLGSRDSVVERISAAVPGLNWIEETPLLERIKDMPDHPFHKLIPTWPEATREALSRSKLLGNLDTGTCSLQLYGFEAQPIVSVHVEVRGNGNPMPPLAAICDLNGWIAIDDSDGKPVDLNGGGANAWDRFREYRDGVVRKIENSNGGSEG